MVSRKNVRLEFPTSTVGYKPYMASLYSMASPLFDFKGHTTITKRILLDSDFFCGVRLAWATWLDCCNSHIAAE